MVNGFLVFLNNLLYSYCLALGNVSLEPRLPTSCVTDGWYRSFTIDSRGNNGGSPLGGVMNN